MLVRLESAQRSCLFRGSSETTTRDSDEIGVWCVSDNISGLVKTNNEDARPTDNVVEMDIREFKRGEAF